MLEGRKRWWGAALGGVGGLGDATFAVSLGIDFMIGGVDATLAVAAFLAVNFAILCSFIGGGSPSRPRPAP